MNATIVAMPGWLQVIAYGLLGLGVVFVVGFIVDYVSHTNHIDDIGRHMVAMSANVGGFFVLYLVRAVWPEFPGRGALLFIGLIALVTNCGIRWRLYRKSVREARENLLTHCPTCGTEFKVSEE